MAKYSISQEGAAELQKLSKLIISNVESIFELGTSLKNDVSSLGESLGIYEDEILDLVNHNQTTLQKNRDVFKILSDALIEKSNEICNLIGFNPCENNGYIENERHTKHLSKDDTTTFYKSGIESINGEIENYKQALMDRGVPEGDWLDQTLAKHKAGMMEQLGYDLDVASGKGANSIHRKDAYIYPADYSSFYDKLAEEYKKL